MTTNQPTGRALAEAAARAMGWTCEASPNEREMLAHLTAKPGSVYMEAHPKAHRATFVPIVAPSFHVDGSATVFVDKRDHAEGPTLREALMRLVVAVAEREAKA